MKEIRFYVTKRDIREGSRMSAWYCPVARAIRRTTGIERVSVGVHVVSIGQKTYALTENASKFVKRFDNGRRVKPFRGRAYTNA